MFNGGNIHCFEQIFNSFFAKPDDFTGISKFNATCRLKNSSSIGFSAGNKKVALSITLRTHKYFLPVLTGIEIVQLDLTHLHCNKRIFLTENITYPAGINGIIQMPVEVDIP